MFKRIVSTILACSMMFAMATTGFATPENIYNLNEKELHYFRQRGFTLSEVDQLPMDVISRHLQIIANTPSTFAAPSNYIAVTQVPTQGTEYFHPSTGMRAGTLADQGNSYAIQTSPSFFASAIFGSSIPQSNYMYYLWGEWDDVAKTHQGVDVRFVSSTPKPVVSAHAGTVVYVGGNYGSVGIYDGISTHYYLHLSGDLPKFESEVFVGSRLGNQGSTGITTSAYHVHYESHTGKSTDGPKLQNGLNTADPYYRMIGDISTGRMAATK